MRTTLTLDDDVRARLEQEVRRSGKSFKEVLNEYLRAGLMTSQTSKPRRKFVVRSWPMGLREELSLDCVAKLLDDIECPLHR